MKSLSKQLLKQPRCRRLLLLTLTLSLVINCSGCSLFVMAGKAMFGDPKVPAPFSSATGTDLTEIDDRVVIVCTVPHGLLSRHPALQIDLVDRVSRNLESEGINIVEPGDVASWFDDHGEWGDFSELSKHFEATYVVHIDVREFDHRMPQSENLMRGQTEGHITVHQFNSKGKSGPPMAVAFDRDFSLTFPSNYPVPREAKSEDLFVQGFTDRLALHLGQHLYDYRMSESIH